MTADAAAAFVPLALERWFASQQRPWKVDLSPSGAAPLTFAELLDLASDPERADLFGSSLGYGPADGSGELRRLIARRHDASADDVIVTCGAIEALHLVIATLVSAGDEVIVQRPMYPGASGLARSRGARVIPWDLDEVNGWRIDLAALERLVTPSTRLVVIAQPTNPMGSVLSAAELRAVVELISRAGAWLVCDEVYRDLVLEPGLEVPSAFGRYERAISIGDVAKPFGLGGLRIGWLVGEDGRTARRIRERRDYTTISTPTVSDALARIALRHASEMLGEPIARARANLDALTTLPAHSWTFVPPRCGTTAFLGVENAAALQRDLAARGILVVPGELFDAPDRLRIWLGGPPDDLAFALDAIAQLAGSDRPPALTRSTS